MPFLLLAACSNGSGNRELSNDEKETATVFEEKHSILCGPSGLSIEESAQRLVDTGIDVIQSDCAYNNLITVISLCGTRTSEILVHKIPVQNVADAEGDGFANTNDIDNDYNVYECS
jgi:hypothetical protein